MFNSGILKGDPGQAGTSGSTIENIYTNNQGQLMIKINNKDQAFGPFSIKGDKGSPGEVKTVNGEMVSGPSGSDGVDGEKGDKGDPGTPAENVDVDWASGTPTSTTLGIYTADGVLNSAINMGITNNDELNKRKVIKYLSCVIHRTH